MADFDGCIFVSVIGQGLTQVKEPLRVQRYVMADNHVFTIAQECPMRRLCQSRLELLMSARSGLAAGVSKTFNAIIKMEVTCFVQAERALMKCWR